MNNEAKADALRRDVAFRALQDAWLEATASYWRRRERDFWWVITGDRTIEPTPAQLARRPDLAAVISACRLRAGFPDSSRMQFAETLTDLASGAAAWA